MRRGLAALLLVACFAGEAAPVAFVADLRGSAMIEGDGKLAFLAELSAGTRLVLGTHASASVAYAASGAEYALVGPGLFLVSAEEVSAEQGAKPRRRAIAATPGASTIARASRAATASLRMRSVASPSPAAALEFPVSTSVATLKPAMRWRASPGQEYAVVLLDASGKQVWRGERARPEGTRPDVALAPGERYSWNVTTGGKSLGEAHFETLPREAIGRAEKSRQGRAFADRVVHALVLQELGAKQEAREAWAELARERPDLPELAALAR
jgi:hypothetical protein